MIMIFGFQVPNSDGVVNFAAVPCYMWQGIYAVKLGGGKALL
jgi:hypothetical protein